MAFYSILLKLHAYICMYVYLKFPIMYTFTSFNLWRRKMALNSMHRELSKSRIVLFVCNVNLCA
jgi:hypothetical protein